MGTALETLIRSLLDDLAVRSTLWLLLAVLGARLARTAAARHLAWTAGLLGVLVLPVLGAVLPSWTLPVLPAAGTVSANGPANGPATHTPIPIDPGEVRAVASPTVPETAIEADDSDRVATRVAGATGPSTTFSPRGPLAIVPPSADPSSTRPVEADETAGATAARTLVWLWVCGVVVLALGLVVDTGFRSRLAARARPLTDPAWQRDLARAARVTGVRIPRMLISGAARVPMTWGRRRPVLVLPESARGWPAAERWSVLLHELAHVRRGDATLFLLGRAACASVWFHPLVWWAAHRQRAESELACDDRVLAAGVRPSSYAAKLVKIARGARREPVFAAAHFARRSGLTERVRAILDRGRDRSAPTRPQVAVGAVLAALLILPAFAAVDPAAREGTSTSSPAESTAAPAAPSAPRVPARSALLEDCGDATSTRVNIDDDEWEVSIRTLRCRFDLDMRGEIVFRDDETGIERMGRRASLSAEERRPGAVRELEAEAGDGGAPAFTWRVDGRARPFDDEARAWVAELIPAVYRTTGLDAEARTRRVLARGGIDAVFDEITLLRSDHVRGRYLTTLMETTELTTGQARRWLTLAGGTIRSDHELASTLASLPASFLVDGDVQMAFVEAARTIESDHELRRTLTPLVARHDVRPATLDVVVRLATGIASDHELASLLVSLTEHHQDLARPDLQRAFVEAARTIQSDHELRRTLTRLLDGATVGEPVLETIAELATSIQSDHELASLLVSLAARYPETGRLPEAYFRAARTISSDHELARTLERSLDFRLDPASLTFLLETATTIGSDHELANLLVSVARRQQLSAEARSAFDRALRTVGSRHEQERASRALASASGG